MSKTNTFESELLAHIFQNAAITLIGDAGGVLPSGAPGSLYVSLHSADPTDAAATGQTTSECAYTTYARVAVVRSAGGWTVSGTTPTTVNPVAAITFPPCTAGTSTATHFGIGTSPSGNGKLLYKGTVTPNISISDGVTPQLTTATAITED